MRKTGLFGVALAALCAAWVVAMPSAMGHVRYEAKLSDTNAKDWSTSASRISCVLSSRISSYGRADFVLLSGAQHRLSLELFPAVEISSRGKMRIVSAPPEWRPDGNELEIGSIDLYRGFRPYVGDSVSWAVLRELHAGQRILLPYLIKRPTFSESIVPVLSPMGFAKSYEEFIACSAQLLPFGYSDVGFIALAFYDTENRLTPISEERLRNQIEYAKLDPAVSKIIISSFGSGHADNLDNIALAKERAESLTKMFVDGGISKDLIETRVYGDEQLATTGYTISERQRSSKAVIELQRDPFKVDRRNEVDMPDIGAPSDWNPDVLDVEPEITN